MITTAIALAVMAGVDVQAQHLSVSLDPAGHEARVMSGLSIEGAGTLRLELTSKAEIEQVRIGGQAVEPRRLPRGAEGAPDLIEIDVPEGSIAVSVVYAARFQQDVAAGERPGQIHNFSVDAHVGPDGVFLSEGSAWHPRPIGADGQPMLHEITVAIEPRREWAFVASGQPRMPTKLTEPCWLFTTPRPVDGCALAGNRHELFGKTHQTAYGPVEIVMHVPATHRDLAPLFIEAAGEYLDLYVPLLGAFPFSRFTIVENFFSSGFAYPGFTLLGPQVVGMAPRSLAPGFLDHELVHNWWGNGVYVDPEDGNWCEALTSYCTNYYRRVAEEGDAAGRAYRRTTLMKLSADPTGLDDGPLGRFGSADPSGGGTSRFVGYDKGAFVFMMLERHGPRTPGIARGPKAPANRRRVWAALRRFASEHLGRRAGWDDLQTAFEAEFEIPLGTFFDRWVRQHTVPVTPVVDDPDTMRAFLAHFEPGIDVVVTRGTDAKGPWVDLDPAFHCYRALSPAQTVPLIGGTFGPGDVRVVTRSERPEVEAFVPTITPTKDGENLLLIGAAAIADDAALLERTGDPLVVETGETPAFTVGGVRYDGAGQAVLHTMVHPDHRGRFITAFHSNGDAGWAKLRLIVHYRRDTTVVFEDGRVIARRTFEPDRRIRE